MYSTTGMPIIVYWYVALIKIQNIKRDANFKKKTEHEAHIFDNMQHCLQHYITHPHHQPVFPVSAFLFKCRRNTGGD
jgi:hypothetical protein